LSPMARTVPLSPMARMAPLVSRRGFLQGASAACLMLPAFLHGPAAFAASGARRTGDAEGVPEAWFDVRRAGAVAGGKTIDSNAINKAIAHVASKGGGVVHFPAGIYACYTIRLKSRVSLHLDPGATLLAAPVPREGSSSGGYDTAEAQGPWEPYQDYGHNHWR